MEKLSRFSNYYGKKGIVMQLAKKKWNIMPIREFYCINLVSKSVVFLLYIMHMLESVRLWIYKIFHCVNGS
jgi:hypothetical protein